MPHKRGKGRKKTWRGKKVSVADRLLRLFSIAYVRCCCDGDEIIGRKLITPFNMNKLKYYGNWELAFSSH